MNVQVDPRFARTLARQAYQRLRQDIVRGKLSPGSKLKLGALVKHYAIGMSPLREALARLVGDQLVMTEDQRGFWVAALSLEELADITHARDLIETEALQLSITRGDKDWEKNVRDAFGALSEVEDRFPKAEQTLPQNVVDEWEDRHNAFHAALISACGSSWLIRLQELLYRQAERYRCVSLQVSRGKRFVHDEHVAIFEAACERNAPRACRLTHDHLMRTYEEVRSAMTQSMADAAAAAADPREAGAVSA